MDGTFKWKRVNVAACRQSNSNGCIIVKNCKHNLRVLMILQTLAIRLRLLETGPSPGSSGGDWDSGPRKTAAVFSFGKQDFSRDWFKI